MVALPQRESQTVAAIYAAYEAKNRNEFRPHLGCSRIGAQCSRALWYEFRWATRPDFEGRMLRLFETGHREEPRLIANLRAIGVQVHELSPETGKQWVLSHGAHIGGSMDGAAVGVPEAPATWHVLEFKTHSEKSFNALKSKKVQHAKPEHFAQMQLYMKLSGMTRALYLAVNKNTDELYAERINYDADTAARLLEKAEKIVSASRAPEGVSKDPSFFMCRFCSQSAVCHKDKFAETNCRTCLHSTADADGWHCAKHDKRLEESEQRLGCASHLFIPDMVPGEQTDAGEDWVSYKLQDGSTYVDGGEDEAA